MTKPKQLPPSVRRSPATPQTDTGRRGPRAARGGARGNAPALTRQGIVDAALSLVAETGVAGLSTRKLGERLGCEAMSIYHHFASKQHLLDAMVDRAIGTIEMPPDDLPALERLRQAMFAYRVMAHRHPALYPYIAVHRLNTPTGARFLESILALVQAVVPDAAQAARHFRTLGYYLAGAALDETAGYAKGPSAAEPVDAAFIARECPRLAAAAPYFQRAQWDATFNLGVQALLAAVQHDAAT
jgi:AcrR family transcriptional regulator